MQEFEWRDHEGIPLISASSLSTRDGVAHAFTTRQGGVSRGVFASLNLGCGVGDDPRAVAGNRTRVLRALGLDPARHVEAEQVHGTRMVRATSSDAGGILSGCDALCTDEPGVVLAVHCADCVPVLLYDPDRPAVGALHAGWRGTAAGAAAGAVVAFARTFGGDPARLVAVLGPAIGPCCYEVDEAVRAAMSRWPWWEEVASPNARGRWQLDLKGAIRRQLAEAGISAERITESSLCTACRTDLFYSYRREGRTGRMAGVIALR